MLYRTIVSIIVYNTLFTLIFTEIVKDEFKKHEIDARYVALMISFVSSSIIVYFIDTSQNYSVFQLESLMLITSLTCSTLSSIAFKTIKLASKKLHNLIRNRF